MQLLLFVFKAIGISSIIAVLAGLGIGIVHQMIKPSRSNQLFPAWLIYSIYTFLINLVVSFFSSFFLALNKSYELIDSVLISNIISISAILIIILRFRR